MNNNNLNYFKNKCLLYYQFLIDNMGMQATHFIKIKDLIEKAYREKNVRQLKAADNDINQQLKEIPLSKLTELNLLFQKELGINVKEIETIRLKNIKKIIKKSKINSPDEFYLLEDRVDEIYNEEDKKDELKSINKLLSTYRN